MYRSTHSFGQHDGPAALPLAKVPLVSFGYAAEWAPEPFWTVVPSMLLVQGTREKKMILMQM
jgi:hypothetical protein